MANGKQDQESRQVDIVFDEETERQCASCLQTKKITSFNGKGHGRLNNGRKKRYRSKICRICERAEKVINGICKMCCQPTKPGSTLCEKHLQTLRICKKRQNEKDKALVLKNYGESCAYCNKTGAIFLTVDHIDNNGAEHRKKLRAGKNQGHNIYAWLRKNNFPAGYQILCYNCNCAKQTHGEEAVKKAILKDNPCKK